MNAIPQGALPYVLSVTMSAAAWLEHFSLKEKEIGQKIIQDLKRRYGGTAYPGSAEEIDEILSCQQTTVREVMDRVKKDRVSLDFIEEAIVCDCPAIDHRDLQKIATLISLIADSNENSQAIKALREKSIRYTEE